MFPEFTINTLSFSRNYYESLINFIHTLFAHPLSFSRIHYFFAKSLSVLRRLCIANTLPASQIHYLFRAFNIVSASSLSFSLIHYLFRAFTIFFPILLFLSRIRYRRESSIFITNLLFLTQIHYLILEITMKHYLFRIHYTA